MSARAPKRSNAPIFWSLFGAGGMLSALIGGMLVLITGLALPLGWGLSPELLSYPRVLAFAQHWLGKGLTFVVIVLFAWHAAHRIFHSLHDIHIHTGLAARLLCYGSAFVASALAFGALLLIGW